MTTSFSTIDPITREVVRNALDSISDEINAALVRAAYSTNVKDRADCSCVLYSPDAEVISMSEYGGTPLHLGTMIWAVPTILASYPAESLGPDDVVIYNSPYPAGPGHLNDICVAGPIIVDGTLVGFAASEAHRVDVGGYAPGSMPPGVTEIYQEGLQIPPIRIVKDGVIDERLLELINANVRTPEENSGDLYAQLACLNVARQRVTELVEKYGSDVYQDMIRDLFAYSEARMANALAAIPDGVWEAEDVLEGDGITDQDITIRCRVIVKDGRLEADFSGSDPQVAGSLNTRPPSVAACVYFVLRCMLDPELPMNAGAYRRVMVRTEPGTLLEARYPAPVSQSNIITTQRVIDVVIAALSPALPERGIAGCQGAMTLLNIGGYSDRDGTFFNYVETYAGGQGAKQAQDGSDVVQNHMTNTRNGPVESLEREHPLLALEVAIREDSEGAGRHRGGMGMRRVFEILASTVRVSLGSDRHRRSPWGVDGGYGGEVARVTVFRANGEVEVLGSKVVVELHQGDRIQVETAGGGGWGEPMARDPEMVRRDVEDQLISPERAQSVYGAAITAAPR